MHLAAVAKFIVVPQVQHRLLAIDDGGLGIENTGVPGADKIAGYDFRRCGEVNLLAQA